MTSDSTRESKLSDLQSQPTRRFNRPTLVRLKPIVVGDRADQRPTIEAPRPVPEAAQPASRHKTRQNRAVSIYARIFGIFILALVGVALVSSIIVYGMFSNTDRVVPGVRFSGQMIGNQPYSQALTTIVDTWGPDRMISLDDGITVYEAPLSDFGITFDATATADSAYAIGHGGSLWANFSELMLAMASGREVPPILIMNRDQTYAAFSQWAETLDIPAQNASLKIDGTEIAIVEAVPGRALAVEETVSMITVNPGKLIESGEIDLAFTEVPPSIMAADLTPVIDQAEAMLTKPVTLTAYEPVTGEYLTYTAGPEDVAGWLTVEEGENGPVIAVSDEASDETLKAFSDTLGDNAYIDTIKYSGSFARALREGSAPTLVINHHPTTYTVQGAESLLWVGWKHGIPYWHFYEANPDVNLEVLYPGQQLVVPSIDVMFPLDVVPDKRIVISISEQHMVVYENGVEVNNFVISTGIPDSPTMPGVFQIFMRDPWAYGSSWDLWMPNFLGIYDSVPGFTNGIHGLPTLSSGGILWANVLGQPASYGCIILNLGPDEWLYDWAPDGTIVEIQR